jgi:DNA-binding HxlR family transcriptional regulator
MRNLGINWQEGTLLIYRYLVDTVEPAHDVKPDAYRKGCASRTVLDVVANKWVHLVVCALRHGPKRFGELRRQLDGVTQKMLTQTVRALERDGLITRTLYPTIPPRVDYELTDLGRQVAALLDNILVWSEQHSAEITAARARYDSQMDEGNRAAL